MSSKYLGTEFDIHTGGVDLIFPHHTNEIAQSEAANGKQFVKYWLHNAHLMVNGEKMSKSLGNFYVLEDLKKKTNLNAIRYFLISSHYRQQINLTYESLKASEEAVKRILDFYRSCEDKKDTEGIDNLIKEAEEEFKEAIEDDLNIAKAISSVFSFIREANRIGAGKKARKFIEKINEVLGLDIPESQEGLIKRISKLSLKEIDKFFYECGWIDSEHGKNKALPEYRVNAIKELSS